MSKRYPVCPECGQVCGHHPNCPEMPEPREDEDARERDEPDYDAPRPLTPTENWQRNDEHNQP